MSVDTCLLVFSPQINRLLRNACAIEIMSSIELDINVNVENSHVSFCMLSQSHHILEEVNLTSLHTKCSESDVEVTLYRFFTTNAVTLSLLRYFNFKLFLQFESAVFKDRWTGKNLIDFHPLRSSELNKINNEMKIQIGNENRLAWAFSNLMTKHKNDFASW